jgi:hypothetical protein
VYHDRRTQCTSHACIYKSAVVAYFTLVILRLLQVGMDDLQLPVTGTYLNLHAWMHTSYKIAIYMFMRLRTYLQEEGDLRRVLIAPQAQLLGRCDDDSMRQSNVIHQAHAHDTVPLKTAVQEVSSLRILFIFYQFVA